MARTSNPHNRPNVNEDCPNDESIPQTRRGNRRFSTANVLLFGFPIAFVVLSTLAFVVATDRLPPLTEWTFDAARGQWAELGRSDYDMEIEISGPTPGVVVIEVRGGKVVAMQRDGQTPKEQRTWNVWSVAGQFEMIDRELDMADDPIREMGASAGTKIELRAEFDQKFGNPVGFQRLVTRGDVPEVEWRVVRFEPK